MLTLCKGLFTGSTILETLLGSLKTRNGKLPSPESCVLIQSIIDKYVTANKRIPVLIPWGPKKTKDDESVDLAELFALNMLKDLNESVQRFHKPGLEINIRLEDYTGYMLEGIEKKIYMDKYMDDFRVLTFILDVDHFITPVSEAQLVEDRITGKFATDFVDENSYIFFDYLMESDVKDNPDTTALDKLGVAWWDS